MVTDKEKNTCTGCTACVNVCPNNCISMKSDSQGFLYPYIVDQDLCTGCGACDRVCELTSRPLDSAAVSEGYGMIARDKELRLCSSSGGVFTLLSNEVLSRGGAVAGVALSKDGRKAFHKMVCNKEDLPQFRGAKYLQSDVGESFRQVRDLLKEGKEVLFSGTPCQVDGLKAFIGKNEERLLCIDMVCHGVPSPLIWQKYCNEIEKKYKGSISSVNFRHKKYSWENPQAECPDSGKVVYRSKYEDPYMRLFLSDYTLRPSCYECRHKGVKRKSDITLADFWGVDKAVPGFSDGAGVSLVIVHTEKGISYIEKIKDQVKIKETDPQMALEFNGAALRSAGRPERLEEFWQDQFSTEMEKLADQYAPVKNELKLKMRKSPLYGFLKKGKKVNMESGICFVIER